METEAKKCVLVPWDLDHSFYHENPVTPVADEFGSERADCQPFEYGAMKLTQRSASCDKLIGGLARMENEYQEALKTLINGPLSEKVIDKKLDVWSAQIIVATHDATVKYDDAVSIEDWKADVAKIKEKTTEARVKIENVLYTK